MPETTYNVRSVVPLSGKMIGSDKRYHLTIRDLPKQDKPREKLLSTGPGSLSFQELLEVVLNTGTKKEGVLAMVSRIAKDYGEKSLFSHTDGKVMARDLDIPLGKALQIIAVGELGRRFFRKDRNGAPVIRTAEAAFEYASDMRHLSREHLRGIYLNAHYQVIHDEIISIGTIDASIVHPREVFRPAISIGAAALILVHNHPSGVLTPSAEDILVTKQISEAGRLMGIELIDHLIVSAEGYQSISI